MTGPGVTRPGVVEPGAAGPGSAIKGPDVTGQGVLGPGVVGAGVTGPVSTLLGGTNAAFGIAAAASLGDCCWASSGSPAPNAQATSTTSSAKPDAFYGHSHFPLFSHSDRLLSQPGFFGFFR